MSKLPPIPKGEPITGSILASQDKRFINALDLLGMGVVNVVVDRVEGLDQLTFMNNQTSNNVSLLYIRGKEKPINMTKACIKSAVLFFGTSDPNKWIGKTAGLHCIDTGKPGVFKYGLRLTAPK